MRNISAIALREIQAYFASPIAYVVTAVFLALTGYFFASQVIYSQEATIRGFLSPSSFILLLLSPLLTMRLLAEEQKMGTLELLLTAPVRDIEVVLGKFTASLASLAIMLGLTWYYPLLLYWFGDPDTGPILSGYLGILLVGASFLSIGLLASSLSSNQIVAAVLALGISIALWILGSAAGFFSGVGADIINYVALPQHFSDFTWGIIDTKDIIYYVSVIAVFVFLTVRSLETRRWR